jgi:hypothetical protein
MPVELITRGYLCLITLRVRIAAHLLLEKDALGGYS